MGNGYCLRFVPLSRTPRQLKYTVWLLLWKEYYKQEETTLSFSKLLCCCQGRSQTFSFGGVTGGASFATRGAVNGLCGTFRKRPEKFWGVTGGPGKFLGGVAPPGTPLAPPLAVTELKNVAVKLRVLGSDIHEMGTLDLAWYFEIFLD